MNAAQNYKCFACSASFDRSRIAKTGTRRDGKRWFLCVDCRDAYKAARKIDRQTHQSNVGMVSGEVLGWNGVPSDRALRKRNS